MKNKVNWLIGTTIEQRRKIELLSIIQSYGDISIEIKPFQKIDFIYNDLPTIGLCSLQQATEILKTTLYPGVYCNLENFKCTQYYPIYSDYLLNSHYAMIPYGDLLNCKENLFNWLGNNNSLFIRPDSGFKEFTGQIVNYETFERDIKSLECLEPQSNLLCVVAEPKNIETEWRLVVANRNVIAGSQYRHEGKHDEYPGFPNDVRIFSKAVIDYVDWQPDLCYTMDVCRLANGELKIIELNSFSCSGLYLSNLEDVVREVREVVIEDWRDIYE